MLDPPVGEELLATPFVGERVAGALAGGGGSGGGRGRAFSELQGVARAARGCEVAPQASAFVAKACVCGQYLLLGRE